MITLRVTVKATCESLIDTLPACDRWYLEDEEYNPDGSGVVTITSDEIDLLRGESEASINENPDIESYELDEPN